MSTNTPDRPPPARRLHWPWLGNAQPHPPPDAGDVVDNFLLPWAGRLDPASRHVEGGGTAPPGPFPPYITPEGRDLRIDLLRGFFVLAMIVDHVRGPSFVQLFTGGNRFFTSAAEGFIFTSGLMAGLVYHRIVVRDGIVTAVHKVLARAFTLFLLTIGITLLLMPISEVFGLPWAQGVDFSHPLDLVISVLTLHRTYYLADVMLLYTLLFVLTPLAFLLMEDHKTVLLLGASWLLWGLHQVVPNYAGVTWPIAGNFLFEFSAWQVLFFSGLVLGYQRNRIPSLTHSGARRLQILTGVALLALIALYVALATPIPAVSARFAGAAPTLQEVQFWIQQNIFGKADLRPGRIVASAVAFTFMFLTLTRQWHWIHRPLEWLLAPLGQNALYAFTAQVVVVAAVALALTPLGLAADSPAWLNAVIQIGSVLLIWQLTRAHVLSPTARTRSYWHATPAVLAILAVILLPWLPVNPALASPAAVSAEVLARARAYGTAVVRVNPGTTGGNGLGTPTPCAPAAAAPALPEPHATPTPAPQVAPTTPPPTSAGPTAAPVTAAAAVAPTLEATRAVTAVQPTATAAQSAAPLAAAPARSPVPPTATAKPAPAPPTATPIPPKPAAIPGASDPLPPLPPDSERLVSQYVGDLAGRAYSRTFHSDLLNRDMPYWIYLPPGYGKDGKRYPVLYALHGGGGKLDEWAAYGLFDTADQKMRTGALPPFIIVLPQGDTSYWTNWSNNSARWGDYLAYEVVNQVDNAFGTLRDRSARAVGGLSMGGWGAAYQGFVHQDIFGAVGMHSPSLFPDDNNLKFLGTGAEFASKDPVSLAAALPGLEKLRIWIDAGQTDPWIQATTRLHDILQGRGVPVDWHLNPDGHNPEYWAQHVPDYLQFYGNALAGK
jgi:enterochelin esterase-like enzyme